MFHSEPNQVATGLQQLVHHFVLLVCLVLWLVQHQLHLENTGMLELRQISKVSQRSVITWRSENGLRDVLRVGQPLMAEMMLMSENGVYSLVVEKEGLVVVYKEVRGPNGPEQSTVWSRGLGLKNPGPGQSCKLSMQSDGNLVLLRGESEVIWSSDTHL